MELGSVISSLQNKTIFVTGATGFLAKIFVEKILRIQPNIAKLYVLLRAANAEAAVQRLHDEVVEKDLFKVMKEKHGENLYALISQKIVALAGDISAHDLGLKDSLLIDNMTSEIDVIINFAATTKFDDRYDVALTTNTFGALNVLTFAKKCSKLKILLHISTAYVCGKSSGLIREKPFYMGEAKKGTSKIDINEEMKLMQQKLHKLSSEDFSTEKITSAMKDFGLLRARTYGWPNTYVFTKAMGEMVMVHLRECVPVVIVRPTIVTSTLKDPFPGWIEGLRTMDILVAEYGRGKLSNFPFNPQTISDAIPADMVVNAIIVAMAAHSKQHDQTTIYHVGSSRRNPFTYSDYRDFCFRYFSKNPCIDKRGNPIKVYHKLGAWKSITCFKIYLAFRYALPLKVLNLVKYGESKNKVASLSRKIKRTMHFLNIYEPYLFFNAMFDDKNTEKLQKIATTQFVEDEELEFDSKNIVWEDYMMNVHMPGLVTHAIRK